MRRTLDIVLVVMLLVAATLGGCAKVLGIRPQRMMSFPHRQHNDKGVNCRECHVGMSTAMDSSVTHIPTTATCVKCHTKPHDPNECSNCHGSGLVRESLALTASNLTFEHKTHVDRLRGQCVRCHSGVTENSDHVRPPMASCLSCHEHQDELAQRACDRCHKDLHAGDTAPSTHLVHEGDWLREHGVRAAAARDLCNTCHAERQCAGCHGKTTPALPERMAFDEPLRAGVHRAGFKSRHSLEAKAQPALCTTCHTTDSCESCHSKNNLGAASGGRSPHPPGWLGLRGEQNEHGRAAWRDPTQCASCHGGAGEQLCVGCHKVGGVGGTIHRPGFRSTLRKTVDSPCRLCHQGAL